MMKIESLSTAADRAGRYWLKLDDGRRVALYRQTIEDFGLYAGLELTDTQWQEVEASAGEVSAKMRAVRIVAATSVSKKDLQHRLVQKGEDPQQAAQAVAWMEELHLLDDAQTALQVVRRCAEKGYGLSRAKQALYEKQIPKQYWDTALADYPDQTEHILAFLQYKLADPSDPKQVKKAIDALLRRGHSYSQIRTALRQLDADGFPEE